MNVTTWSIIAIVGFSLSGIALIAAVFMFIKLNVPAIIGDLSGKTVAREIKAIRDANASSGNRLHKTSSVNIDRDRLTEKVNDKAIDGAAMAAVHASRRLDKTGSGQSSRLKNEEFGSYTSGAPKKGRTTEYLSANVGEVDIEECRATAVLSQNRVTDVLSEERKTDILVEPRGTEVLSESRQTEVLSQIRQTEVLTETDSAADGRRGMTVRSETEELVQDAVRLVAFKVTKSVIKTHTDEVI